MVGFLTVAYISLLVGGFKYGLVHRCFALMKTFLCIPHDRYVSPFLQAMKALRENRIIGLICF
jgi:hypothetical protein